jgi:phenylacetate-CoA ligase
MARITGRSDDLIILRGVNVFPTQLEEVLLGTEGLAPHFQLVLTRDGRLDAMAIRVEARADCTADRRAAAAAEVAAAVKDRVGVSVSVEVIDPDTLERSVGKLQRVVDRR